jgi:hypothetical protein
MGKLHIYAAKLYVEDTKTTLVFIVLETAVETF